MNKRHLKILLVILIAGVLSRCSCGPEKTEATGSEEESTNGLVDPQPIDLFLDAIRLEIDVNTGGWENLDNDAEIEIHIMDENEETLLACTGSSERLIMEDLREDILYAQMNAQFNASSGTVFDDSTPIVLRLINKGAHDPCPSGYDSSETGSNGSDIAPDRVVAGVSLNYDALFSGAVDIDGAATVYFKTEEDDPFEPEEAADQTGGDLAINQVYLSEEEFNDDESSHPEVELFLAPFGSFDFIACVDLEAVEAGSLMYAELDFAFQDTDENAVTLDDLDEDTAYWLILAEMDEDRCPDSSALSDGEYDLLATTGSLTRDDLLADEVDFDDDFGFVNLYLK